MIGPVDPLATDVVLCIYAETLDAFVGAWVVRKAARQYNIPVEFVAGLESVYPPHSDRNFIIIGGDGVCLTLSKSTLNVPDPATPESPHWKKPLPFAEWGRTMPFGIETMGDNGVLYEKETRLSMVLWRFFYDTEPPPRLVLALNAVATSPDDAALCECVESYPLDFVTIDKLVVACENPRKREMMIAAGQGILRYREKNHA